MCWAMKVKNLLCSYGFGYVWYEQYVYDKYNFIKDFKLRVTDVEKQKYYEIMSSQSKLKYYKIYLSIASL